jgi:cytochrome c peroxidase
MFIGLPSRLWLYCVVGLTSSCSDGHGWGALVDSKQMRQSRDAVRETPLVREPTDEREAALARLSAADRGQLVLALDAADLSWDRRDHPPDPDAERALEGALNFFLPFPDGNGRACATCHLPSDGFSISPATVEARWQRLEHARRIDPAADDPLFRALDADDGQLDFTLLRTRALIKVRVPLPSRVRLSDSPNASEVTVSRAVPALNMLEHTAPYQQDRSAATLEEQARGAVFAHMEPSAEPSLDFLETIAEFERRVFSSPGVKKLSRAIDREQPLPEIDPELNSLEQRGKEKFDEFCSKCHGGPAQVKNLESRIFPPFDGSANPRSLNVGISNPLPDGFPASPIQVPERHLLAQRFSVDLPDGTTAELLSSDPGTVLTDEQALETVAGNQVFNRFDIPQLRGINQTAPYFHDHRANTLEEVVKHYQAFFFFINVVRGLPLPKIPDEDIAPIVAYMKRAL